MTTASVPDPDIFALDKDWIKYFASTVAILGDARAIEESITVSYMWRENPGFTVAFSPGVFRHKRVDRARYLEVVEDEVDVE
ncbi:unnamed protein product [Amoebophrya sp. A120]|nr:unnamed protein product [Amoebophrya sp. A120]|eukprot:GSA120T00013299001.1